MGESTKRIGWLKKMIGAWFSEADARRIYAAAARRGITVSDFLRLALEKEIKKSV